MPELVETRDSLLAIREAGYWSFAPTLAALIDNSVPAKASEVPAEIIGANGGRMVVILSSSSDIFGTLYSSQFGK